MEQQLVQGGTGNLPCCWHAADFFTMNSRQGLGMNGAPQPCRDVS